MEKILTVNTDGGARGNPRAGGDWGSSRDSTNAIIGQHKQYIGEATNNVAEYKALILALEEARKLGTDELVVNMDSELVVKQMQGLYKIKEPGLKILAADALKLIKNFKRVTFKHVRREFNAEADALVNEAIDAALVR